MIPILWRFALVCCLALSLTVGCGQAPPPNPSRPLVDGDGDGYAAIRHGGRDCNDDPATGGATVNPLAKENPKNKLDDNCNGQIDEFTIETGYWKLTTPEQNTAQWHINVRTDPDTGVQYVSCLQFSFQLKSTVSNTIFNITQWQSNLSPLTIKIFDNKFKWVYDGGGQADNTLRIQFTGEVLDTNGDNTADTMKGTLVLEDVDKNVLAKIVLNFTGKPQSADSKDASASKFCERCYGDATCSTQGEFR